MSGTSPCASCKLLRRRCAKDCIFAPFFPSDNPHKFAIVHKVFGASNVSKMLQELPIEQRGDAVSSLVYEANARMRDPVYGCVGAISNLQNQMSHLQMQLAVAQAKILCIQMQYEELQPTPLISTNHHHPNQRRLGQNPELDLQYDESSTYEMMQGEFINFPSSSNVAQEPFKRVTLDIKLSDKIR